MQGNGVHPSRSVLQYLALSWFRYHFLVCFICVDSESRTNGKAAVDVIGNPLGKSGGSLLQQVIDRIVLFTSQNIYYLFESHYFLHVGAHSLHWISRSIYALPWRIFRTYHSYVDTCGKLSEQAVCG